MGSHRSTQAAQELLGERFGGVLVADAYASYNGIHPKARQSCLAHIKTKAKELDQELAFHFHFTAGTALFGGGKPGAGRGAFGLALQIQTAVAGNGVFEEELVHLRGEIVDNILE